MSEKAEYLLKQLNNILITLKKSINNKIKLKTLIDKRQSARDLNSKIEILLLESSLSDTQLSVFVKLSKNTLSQIEKIINQKLSETPKPPIRFKTVVKILIWLKINNMALDIKTAAELASLIPTYDGSPGGVKSFTDAISFVETIVPAANTDAAIRLILSKLNGKARDLFTATPTTYQDIKDKITANCGEKISSDLALANLKNIKPRKGQDTCQFTKEIDNLTDKVKQAFIREQVPQQVASNLANKAAINSLIAASQKQETKMLLKVGKFASLSEALNIVVENENFNNESSASMLHFKKNFQQHNKFNYQHRFNGNTRGNFRNFRGSHQRASHHTRLNQQPPNRYPKFNHQQYPRQQNWNPPGNRRIFQLNGAYGAMPPNQFAPNGAMSQPVSVMPSNLIPPQTQQQQTSQHASNNFLGTPFLPSPYSQ